jgi:hypothetical protein
MTQMQSTSLTDIEAAAFLGLKPQTLRNWRHLSKGPAYSKMGSRCRYTIEDLEKFRQQKRIEPEPV